MPRMREGTMHSATKAKSSPVEAWRWAQLVTSLSTCGTMPQSEPAPRAQTRHDMEAVRCCSLASESPGGQRLAAAKLPSTVGARTSG
ncbi:unnamed protein product [Symbiodinium natans]|uniref:Uncharacterized protein n=1 Tax=Symbiodinium natans TaxID=878477 RepID=A0A812UH03_9DINO|nr:unnamed protein product [Symbiodinium natans]